MEQSNTNSTPAIRIQDYKQGPRMFWKGSTKFNHRVLFDGHVWNNLTQTPHQQSELNINQGPRIMWTGRTKFN